MLGVWELRGSYDFWSLGEVLVDGFEGGYGFCGVGYCGVVVKHDCVFLWDDKTSF